LEECSEAQRYQRENYWIDFYDTIKNGENKGTAGIGCSRKQSKEEIENRISQIKARMPRFKITTKNGGHKLFSNCYDAAAEFTGFSRCDVRRKIKGQRNCRKYNYEYTRS
jgi:hypothetical protein